MDGRAIAQLLPLVLIALVFWFLIVRPQRRRAAALADVQRSVQPGTEVMLNSGIFGTVESVEDEVVSVRVAPSTTLRVHRQAVARVVEPVQPAASEAQGDALPPGATTP
jgi:preprotein translocase subunit YajC